MTGNIAEQYYDTVCSYFDHYPKDIIPIIIYDDEKEIMDTVKIKGGASPTFRSIL